MVNHWLYCEPLAKSLSVTSIAVRFRLDILHTLLLPTHHSHPRAASERGVGGGG